MTSPTLHLRTRPLARTDVDIAVDWMAAEWRLSVRLSRQLRPLVIRAAEAEQIRGGCIEFREPGSTAWSMAAVGLTAFVAEPLIAAYLSQPVPFPSLFMFEQMLTGVEGVFLGPREVAKANADGGLNQVTIYYGQVVKDPGSSLWRQILPASHKLHLEVHGGYQLRRLLQDESTQNEAVFLHAGYRLLCRFPAGLRCPLGMGPLSAPRSLVGLTAAEAALQLPGTTASFLFEYRPPHLGLTNAERRLLVHALSIATDAELSKLLNLSANTIKTTWRRIYERFENRLPFVTETAPGQGTDSTRGAEKRRRVLAYVQEHREELRPHAPGGKSPAA